MEYDDEMVGEICANDYNLRVKGGPTSASAPSTFSQPIMSTNRGKMVGQCKSSHTINVVNLYYNFVEDLRKKS